ncbi:MULTISPECIES: hypothetical protein [Bradyrhizobium]|uniref:hypothetical protein n=1 Tax=Bradyrhizobium TaxID=374 RepID=UPI0004B95D4A|nr:hypothetical protein [Bradyrhizobium sp. CCBAU 15544]
MKQLLKRWWDGKYVPPRNDPNGFVFILQGDYERHWTSKAAHVVAGFWLKYWQWSIGIAVTLFLGLRR